MDTKASKKFYLFLIINSLIWILVSSLRAVVSRDSMEAIAWGQLLSLGTNKHPPLSGWLAGGFYGLFQEHNFAIYLLGTLCVSVSMFYIYKLAKYFMDDTKSICASLIMSSCFYYSYHIFYDNFNCNILAITFWSMLSYYFYKAVRFEKLKTWLIFGILSGLAFLAKYQVIILFLGMFLYLLLCDRKQFKQKGIYLAVFSGSLVILPHVIWLYQNDFFPFIYFIDRTQPTVVSNNFVIMLIRRSVLCIKFYLDQLLALAPCFALYLILALQERNIAFDKHAENKKDTLFVLLIGLFPIIFMGISGFITGSRVIGAWGSAMITMTGLLLFYYFPIKFRENSFDKFFRWIVAFALVWQISMAIFALLQNKIDMGYPYKTVMNDFNKIYTDATHGKELKYVYGGIDYTFQFQLHNPNKPKVILDTYGHENPWVNINDAKKEGVLVIDITKEGVENYTTLFCEDKCNNLEVHKYIMPVKNILKMADVVEMYYIIIKPQAD